MLIVVAGKLQYGDVPKRLKGPHSKCGRSGNWRESSNLSISAKNIPHCSIAMGDVFMRSPMQRN